MKKIIIVFVSTVFTALGFLTLSLNWLKPVSAEILPWGIAINEEAGQCAGFWGGDEFSENNLPNGWQDYYPKQYLIKVETAYGTCVIDKKTEDFADCCRQLGLKVADIAELNYEKNEIKIENLNHESLDSNYKCRPVFNVNTADNGFYINKKTKECAAFGFKLENDSFWVWDEEDRCLKDDLWEKYDLDNGMEYLNIIETPQGTCEFKKDDDKSEAKSCCEALGYQFVSENIAGKDAKNHWWFFPVIPGFVLMFLVFSGGIAIGWVIFYRLKVKLRKKK